MLYTHRGWKRGWCVSRRKRRADRQTPTPLGVSSGSFCCLYCNRLLCMCVFPICIYNLCICTYVCTWRMLRHIYVTKTIWAKTMHATLRYNCIYRLNYLHPDLPSIRYLISFFILCIVFNSSFSCSRPPIFYTTSHQCWFFFMSLIFSLSLFSWKYPICIECKLPHPL